MSLASGPSVGAGTIVTYGFVATSQVQSHPPQITLSWDPDAQAVGYDVYRRVAPESPLEDTGSASASRTPSGTLVWANLPAAVSNVVDTDVTPGVKYIYYIEKTLANAVRYNTRLTTGVELPVIEDRGIAIMVVDRTVAAPLARELDRLETDLSTDGWTVVLHEVNRVLWNESGWKQSVADLRNTLRGYYDANPSRVRCVLLIGHVPVPYSGLNWRDDAASYSAGGAQETSMPYADLNGNWTDLGTHQWSSSSAIPDFRKNLPGDGKFDQHYLPSSAEVAVGRLDFSNLPAFRQPEVALLREYLDRDHAWRRGRLPVRNMALAAGNDFYRAQLATIVPRANIVYGDWRTQLSPTSSFLWATIEYGGSPTGTGYAATPYYSADSHYAVFNFLGCSNGGDFQQANSILNAIPAGRGWGLAVTYWGRYMGSASLAGGTVVVRPSEFVERLAIGESLGDNWLWFVNGNLGGVDLSYNLFGDPTLRLHPVTPPRDVRAVSTPNGHQIMWIASADSGVSGYHVYRSLAKHGPFTRLTSSMVTDTAFTAPAEPGDFYYQVRAVRLESRSGPSYWNPSLGVITKLDEGAEEPTVTLVRPTADHVWIPSGAGLQLEARVTSSRSEPPGVKWTKVSGPGDVTFDRDYNGTTGATFAQGGTYRLQVQATSVQGQSAIREVTVEVGTSGWTGNRAPTVTLPSVTTFVAGATTALSASVVDDGVTGQAPTTQWQHVGGDATLALLDPTAPATSLMTPSQTAYPQVLRLSADDGEVAAFKDLRFTVGTPNPVIAIDYRSQEGVVVPVNTRYGSGSTVGWYPYTWGSGAFPDGSATTHTFVIKNTGNANLDVASPLAVAVAIDCSPEITTQPAATITPGGSSLLQIAVNPASADGLWMYEIHVGSSDPAQPTVILHANGGPNSAPSCAIQLVNGKISSPLIYSAPANLSVTILALDADGLKTRVELFQGNTKIGESVGTASPRTIAWNNVPAGEYSLTARATDSKGTVTESLPLHLSVTTTPLSVPTIAAEPADAVGLVGGTASFEVVTSSAFPVTYAWSRQRPGSPSWELLPEAVGARLVTPTLTLEDSGTKYFVWANNGIGKVASRQALLTVTATPPTVAFDATERLGSEAGGPIAISVLLSSAATESVEVPLVSGGTARVGFDYLITPANSLTFAPGQTAVTVTIVPVDDHEYRPDRTVVLGLAASANAVVGSPGQMTVTLRDDDPLPSRAVAFAAENQSVIEGGGSAMLTLRRLGDASEAVSVSYATRDVTAIRGVDYTPVSGTVTWPDGDSSPRAVSIPLINDDRNEANEEFYVDLLNPVGATVVSPAVVTIAVADDDPIPAAYVASFTPSLTEGAGSGTVVVALTAPSAREVLVPFAVSGTAIPTADYGLNRESPLVFAPGTTTVSLAVSVVDDAVFEAEETVVVTLGAPTAASLGTPATATLTLLENDPQPAVYFQKGGSSLIREPTTGSISIIVSGETQLPITLPFAVSSTATSGTDFVVDTASPLTIKPGGLGSVTFRILADAVYDPDESFTITLGNPTNARVSGPPSHVVMIANDQTANPMPTVQFSLAAQSWSEGAGPAVVTARLSAASGVRTLVPFVLSGSATAGLDYTVAPSPLVIPAGATTADLVVNVTDDGQHEPDEVLIVTMGAPVGATRGAVTVHTLTVTDNDPIPPAGAVRLGSSAISVAEGAGAATVTVQREGGASGSIAVQYATADGSAVAGQDYAATSGMLTWSDGDASPRTITVPIVSDPIDEGNESFTLSLSNPFGAELDNPASTRITIQDDDTLPTLSFSTASVTASEGGGPVVIPVRLSAPSTLTATVPFTVSGTARQGVDYALSPSKSVTIPAGATYATITVYPVNDTSFMADRSVILALGTPVNAVRGTPATTTVSLVDDDPQPQTIAFGPLPSRTYGDSPLPLEATASSGLPVTFSVNNPAVAVVGGSQLTIIAPGTVGVTASQPGNQTFTAAPAVTRTLVVAKRTVTAQADNKSRVYRGSDPEWTITYSGFLPGDDASVLDVPAVARTSASVDALPGTYAITVTPGTDANYAMSPVNGTLTVYRARSAPSLTLEGESVSVAEGSVATLQGTFSDATDNSLVTVRANLGTVSQDDANGTFVWSYAAADGPDGSVQVTITADDGVEPPVSATFDLLVTNVAPEGVAQELVTNEDTVLPITLTASDPGADSHTFVLVDLPLHGSLVGTPPELEYHPAANWFGEDAFTFRAIDSDGAQSSDALIIITVTAVNDPPTLSLDTDTVAVDEGDVAAVSGTFSDVEGSSGVSLRASVGVVTADPVAGRFVWTFPTADGPSQSQTVTITATDDVGQEVTATLALTVGNVAPAAVPQNLVTAEDVALPITLTAIDPGSDAHLFTVTSGPSEGTLSGTPPNLVYHPSANWYGTDQLRFIVTDSDHAVSAEAAVHITVTPVNDAPVLSLEAGRVSVSEGSLATVHGTFGDPEGNGAVDLIPSVGVIVRDDELGTFTWEYLSSDGPDESGTVTITADDHAASPVVATIDLTVENVAPNPLDQVIRVLPGQTRQITLLATDPGQDAVSYQVVTGPTHGSLIGTAPEVWYTPNPGYQGPDAFTFQASDSDGAAGVAATVEITVSSVNTPPTLSADSTGCTVAEGSIAVVTGRYGDNEGARTVDVTASIGVVEIDPDANTWRWTYSSTDGPSESQTVTIAADDGIAPPVSVAFDLTVLNVPPIAQAQTEVTAEDTALPLTLTADDPGADVFTFTITRPPTHGALTGTPPNLVYVPLPDWSGTTSFSFMATDKDGEASSDAVVTIQVNPVNDPPTISTSTTSLTVAEGGVALAQGFFSDADGNATVTLSSDSGTIVRNDEAGTWTWSFSATNGPGESRAVTISAADGQSDPRSVSFSLVVENVPPTALSQALHTDEDVPVPVLLTASDPGADSHTFAIARQPLYGSLTGTPPALTYLPAPNWHGADSFAFRATDSDGAPSDEATIAITVHAVNDSPTLSLDFESVVVPEGATATLTGSFDDVDGRASVTLTPSVGAIDRDDTAGTFNWSYVTGDGADLAQTVTITADDGSAPVVTATFTLIVENVAPTAIAAGLMTDEDTPLLVTLQASDPGGDVQSFTIQTAPNHGTLSGTLPNLRYTPAPDWSGTDSFRFSATDKEGASSSEAVVTITVNPVNDPPRLVLDATRLTAPEGTTVSLTGSLADPDGIASVTLTADSGIISRNDEAGTWQWTGAAGDGPDDTREVRIVADDGTAPPVSGTFQLVVENVAPIAIGNLVTLPEDSTAAITLAGDDPGGDALTFTVTRLPQHGALGGAAPYVTYTPDANYHGSDSFGFMLTDHDGADSAEATVTLDVTPVNDPPVLTLVPGPVRVREGDFVSFTGLFSDPDGNAGVTLTASVGELLRDDATGILLWHFRASDGPDESQVATITADDGVAPAVRVSFALEVENVAPSTSAQRLSTDEDSALLITVQATDPGQDEVAIEIVSAPLNGQLTGSPPDLTYLPDQDWSGTDQFTVRALDSDGATGADSLITITVNPVNDSPVGIALLAPSPAEDGHIGTAPPSEAGSVSVDENQPAGTPVGTFVTSDPDLADSFRYELVAGEGSEDNGSFVIEGDQLKTLASFDRERQDHFNIRVRSTDSGGLSVEQGFAVTVNNLRDAQLVGRYIFYNQSSWDGKDAAANARDDGAIAPDKRALLPGQKAAFANYTSYSRGINGIMVDIAGLAGTPTADDFSFKVGNSDDPATWAMAPMPSSITVRKGAGASGSDRITLIWPNWSSTTSGGIAKTWLQVVVKSSANTDLATASTFYFGNAVGEAGDTTSNALVNATDQLQARNNTRTPANLAPIDFRWDFDRDKLVNATDEIIARNNTTTPANALKLISPPNAGVGLAGVEPAARPESSLDAGSADGAGDVSAKLGDSRRDSTGSIVLVGGHLGWQLRAGTGGYWQLETTDDLAGAWVPVPDSIIAAGADQVVTWTITVQADQPARFFRAVPRLGSPAGIR